MFFLVMTFNFTLCKVDFTQSKKFSIGDIKKCNIPLMY